MITDNEIEKEAAAELEKQRRYLPDRQSEETAEEMFIHGAKWARDLMQKELLEAAGKAFEAGEAHIIYSRGWYSDCPDKESYLKSLTEQK